MFAFEKQFDRIFLQAPTAANKTPPNTKKVDFSQMMKIKEEEETPPICHIRAPPRKPSNPVPIDINDDSDCDFELPVRQTPQNSRSIGSKSKVGFFIRGYIIIFLRESGQQNFLEKSKRTKCSKRLVRVPLTKDAVSRRDRNDSAN